MPHYNITLQISDSKSIQKTILCILSQQIKIKDRLVKGTLENLLIF